MVTVVLCQTFILDTNGYEWEYECWSLMFWDRSASSECTWISYHLCKYLFWSESPELCLVLWCPGALWLLLWLLLLLPLLLLLSDESLVSFLLLDLLPFVRRSGLPITVSGDWELGLPDRCNEGHASLQELPVGGVPVGVMAADEDPPSWLEPSLAIVCGEPVFFLQWETNELFKVRFILNDSYGFSLLLIGYPLAIPLLEGTVTFTQISLCYTSARNQWNLNLALKVIPG